MIMSFSEPPLIEISICYITEMDYIYIYIYIYIYLQIMKQLYKYSFSMSIYQCPISFFLPLNSLPRYLTQFSFYVMESRVSRKCTRNIHRPSTPGKEVNRGKDCQKATAAATYSKVYTYSDIDLGEVLFNYVIFLRQRKQGSFELDLSCFLRWNFQRSAETLNIFVPSQ